MPRNNEKGATHVYIRHCYFLCSAFPIFCCILANGTTLVEFTIHPIIQISHRQGFQSPQVCTALSSAVNPSSKDKQEGTIMQLWISKKRLHLKITNAISVVKLRFQLVFCCKKSNSNVLWYFPERSATQSIKISHTFHKI